MHEDLSSPQGLVGKAFEDWLTQKYGGEGAFRVDGRDFDGGQGHRHTHPASHQSMVDQERNTIYRAAGVSDESCSRDKYHHIFKHEKYSRIDRSLLEQWLVGQGSRPYFVSPSGRRRRI